MIWKTIPTIEGLNALNQNCLVTHLGIKFTEVGSDFLIAEMPVDERTKQPMGLLHGGASVALAETLGSVASVFVVEDPMAQKVVGVEINANHLRSVTDGIVYGKVTPIKIGRSLHIWNITITNAEGKEICISRLTTLVK